MRPSRLFRWPLWTLASIATLFLSSNGVPVLRHDWGAPNCGLAFARDALSGWDPTGLGAPIGYPSSFLFWPLRAVIAAIVGTYAAHVAFFFACNALIAFGADRLCRHLGGTRAAAVAVVAFALFNPWLYVQLVAGHAYVVLAYGALLWVAAEAVSDAPDVPRLVLISLALVPQIQYLVLGAPVYAWLSVRSRDWRPVAALALLSLPVVAGIATARSSLLDTPFSLAWERSQSLAPLAAAGLSGYFTSYDSSIEHVAWWAMLPLVVICSIGAIAGLLAYRRPTLAFVSIGSVALLWSTGIHGIEPLFTWTVTHVAEVQLFRELYVLLGVLAVCYVALLSIASRTVPALGYAAVAAALALPFSWTLDPPLAHTTSDASLPHVRIDAVPGTRFLLLPAIAPMRFGGKGSGVDPDLCPSVGGASPINEYVVRYPVSSAIGKFYRDGSTDDLAALGVTRIYDRPGFSTDPSIRGQLAFPFAGGYFDRRPSHVTLAHAASDVTLSALPSLGSLASAVGAGNVLDEDAARARGNGVPASWSADPGTISVAAPRRFVKAADGWVDARLGFLQAPQVAQPLGGALTTNPEDELPLSGHRYALVYVDGELRDVRGPVLAARTHGYRWIAEPPGLRGVRCRGLCVVAAQRDAPARVPLDPPKHRLDDQPYVRPATWFVRTHLTPAPNASLLRYDVAFDGLWLAFAGTTALAHVRIDGSVNGWILPPAHEARTVTLIEAGAFAVSAAEAFAVAGFAIVLRSALRTSRKRCTP